MTKHAKGIFGRYKDTAKKKKQLINRKKKNIPNAATANRFFAFLGHPPRHSSGEYSVPSMSFKRGDFQLERRN